MSLEQPAIQFWTVEAAPERVRVLLPAESSYGWVAIVPAELRDSDVLSLLTSDREPNDQWFQTDLPSGECLFAGPLQSKQTQSAHAPSSGDQLSSQGRRAMSAGHTPGSTRADYRR